MVSTQPPTSKPSRPFYNPLVTVPKAPITIGIIVTFMFLSFQVSMFPFPSQVQVFWCEMLFINRLKRPELFFFPFLFPSYCHSVVHRVVSTVNSPLSYFPMWSSSRCIEASTLSSMLVSSLPHSFLDTYSLSMWSLGCNALCMVISFLVLWSICLSSSLVHFRKCPELLFRLIV